MFLLISSALISSALNFTITLNSPIPSDIIFSYTIRESGTYREGIWKREYAGSNRT